MASRQEIDTAQAPLEPTDLLVTALIAAQGKMQNALINKENPHFKSKYADFSAIREATLPVLNANGLAIIQFTWIDDGGNLLLHTRIAHKSGQYIESVYPLPIALDKPQAMGSALTYAKRYSWAAMCGIASEEDDDGNAAEGAGNGSLKKSAHKARKDGDYEALRSEINAARTVKYLEEWGLTSRERVWKLPDSWQAHLREEYERRLTELREGVTEDGKTLKGQIKASLELEDAETE